MNLCNPITLLQPNFDINQSPKTTFIQTMTTYTKRDTNERQDINAQSIAHRFQTHRNSNIYLGAKFFSHIMCVYMGGGFRLAIMRVYICGKIFALHNTHIKTWRKSQNHNAKDCLESIKIFRQKCICVGDFKGFM